MKTEAAFFQSLRDGAIDSAVLVLKRVHDMKQMQAQARVKPGAPAAIAGVPVAPAMGNVLFSLASAQVRLFTELLKQQETVAHTVQGAVADALGVPRPGAGAAATQVLTWRVRRPADGAVAPAVRRRFVVRNAKEAAGIEVTLRPFTVASSHSTEVLVGPHAVVRVDGRALAPRVLKDGTLTCATIDPAAAVAEGMIAKDATALVEVELDLASLLDEVGDGRYAAAMTVALVRGPDAREAAQAMTLELVVA